MNKALKIGTTICAGFLVMLLSVRSFAQSFSVDTDVTQSGGQYAYIFTLNYDQSGSVKQLTDSIWDWTFYIDPSAPAPTAIALPTGWKSTYDQPSGEFDFYTEGPDGFGSGDFGSDVIQPGLSLSGFGLTTPATPGLSVAFATDEQYNQDANTATLPTSSTPEPGPLLIVGIGFSALGMVALGRRTHRPSNNKRAIHADVDL